MYWLIGLMTLAIVGLVVTGIYFEAAPLRLPRICNDLRVGGKRVAFEKTNFLAQHF